MEAPVSTPTPLPKQRLAILLSASMADALAVTIVFPFLPFMVQDLMRLPDTQQYQIGYFVGLLGGSYECGQIISSSVWATLSDKYGRRPIILLCMLTSASFMFALGFSRSLWEAILLRFCQGLGSGAMTVGRTYMSDITDESNETSAFALMGVVWGLGDIIGPALGGLLSRPVVAYPYLFSRRSSTLFGVLDNYPYLLPCAFVSVFGVSAFAFAFMCLPESRHPEHRDDSNLEGAQSNARLTSGLDLLRHHPRLRVACCLAVNFGLGIAAYDQTMSVWARDQLGFTPKDLGVIQSSSGIVSIFASYILITRLVEKVGNCNALCISLCCVGLGYFSPVVNIMMGRQDNRTMSWIVVSISYYLKALGVESCFTGFFLLLKHCAPAGSLGATQGIGSGFLSLGLALGPVWGPSIFAWSSKQRGPHSGALPFVLLAALTGLAVVSVRSLQAMGWRGSASSFLPEVQDTLLDSGPHDAVE